MSAKTSPQTREQKQRMRVSKKASDAFLVLVVEDEHFLSDIYEHQLKKEGFQVLVAHNGEEALAFMKKQKPQVILLDLVMPKMNGFEFLEHLSKEPSWKNIPVIVLSNLGQDRDREFCEKLGVRCHLIKIRVSTTEVIEEVKKYLKEA